MHTESTYSREQIVTICQEIERQWDYQIIARALLPLNANNSLPKYSSPPFYDHLGASFDIIVKNPSSPLMRRALNGVPHWLNQNFIIRLFGVLDEHNAITAGRKANNVFSKILAALRHRVAAHTSGSPNPQSSGLKELTELMKAHLDPTIDSDNIRDFRLDIDTVLCRLKDKCIEFVQTLEGKEVPKKHSVGSR